MTSGNLYAAQSADHLPRPRGRHDCPATHVGPLRNWARCICDDKPRLLPVCTCQDDADLDRLGELMAAGVDQWTASRIVWPPEGDDDQ